MTFKTVQAKLQKQGRSKSPRGRSSVRRPKKAKHPVPTRRRFCALRGRSAPPRRALRPRRRASAVDDQGEVIDGPGSTPPGRNCCRDRGTLPRPEA